MKKNDNIKISLELKPQDLLIAFNQKLIESTNAVFFGINAFKEITELPDTLSIDKKSIFTNYPIGKLSLKNSKHNFKEWILKKGFGDLIIALTELLISFSFVIDLENKINKKSKATINEFIKLIFQPNYSNTKKSFPELIKKIERKIGEPLLYRSEILSINQTRRCLEHRNGIVKPTDFNIENGIELKWIFYEVFTNNNGKIKPIERFEKVSTETKIIINEIPKNKFFKENEIIKISFQEFNELAHFCKKFGFHLLDKYLTKK